MTGHQEQSAVYRFDRFCLDVARGSLQGPDGGDRPLRPKAFALLCHLLEHPGRLHTREALFETLWPGVIVTDDSLTQCVSDLRRAFGERANLVLKTLPRRGYVLTAEVERHAAKPAAGLPASLAPASVHAWSGADLEAARCALVLMERPHSAHGDDAAALASEIQSELFMGLARFEDLRVVNGAGSGPGEGYRVRSDVHEVGRHLRCAVLLEDAQTGAVLWAEQHDVPMTELAALDGALIAPLANRLARQVAVESGRRARHKSLAMLSARELCLIAGDHHQRGTEADTAVAHDLLERAIALDPDYAPAYAWQAYVVQRGLTYGWGRLTGEAARDRALALARHGAVLAPDSPLCLSRLAYCLLLSQHQDEAVATARTALNGTRAAGLSACITCCEVLAHSDRADEAVAVMARMLELDPYGPPTVYAVLGRSLLMAGEPEEALPPLRICAARLPDYAPCHHSLLIAAHETGRSDEARRALAEIRRLQPSWNPMDGAGQWFFFRPEDAARFQSAFAAVQTKAAPHHIHPEAPFAS